MATHGQHLAKHGMVSTKEKKKVDCNLKGAVLKQPVEKEKEEGEGKLDAPPPSIFCDKTEEEK